MDPIKRFEQERERRIQNQGKNMSLLEAVRDFQEQSIKSLYSYNFSWMGRPIIQYPQDIVMMQEILWDVKPDLVIETGIAHGGSIIFYASILELMGKGEVLGIDIEIRPHNRKAIEVHPMFKRITMIEGSSVSPEVVEQVKTHAESKQAVLVCLDSNHTHDHVLHELELYSSIVTPGSYIVVFDTIIEYMADDFFTHRSWGKGNNPRTAVQEFLRTHDEFVIDGAIQNKLLITVAPEGYLKRIK